MVPKVTFIQKMDFNKREQPKTMDGKKKASNNFKDILARELAGKQK